MILRRPNFRSVEVAILTGRSFQGQGVTQEAPDATGAKRAGRIRPGARKFRAPRRPARYACGATAALRYRADLPEYPIVVLEPRASPFRLQTQLLDGVVALLPHHLLVQRLNGCVIYRICALTPSLPPPPSPPMRTKQ